MKIEWIELRQTRLTMVAPFETGSGVTSERTCLIVCMHGEGITGLAECVAPEDPWYTYETIATARLMLCKYLIPPILGADVNEPADLPRLFPPVRGHAMAKAALEMASWDLIARARGISLSRLLGGTQDRVPVGVSVGIQSSPRSLVETVGGYLSEGYRRVKLKIMPGHDITFVRAVRDEYPDAVIQVDANSRYTLSDIQLFRDLDEMNLLLIEQPLGADDIVDHAHLQKELSTALCLDESIHSPHDARHALELGSCRIINIKPGRVGGHGSSKAIHDLCLHGGFPVWCGGMLESNVGRAHNVALASLPGFTLPGDVSASARYYRRDIASPGFTLNGDSTITIPSGPGIGVDLDPDIIWDRRERFDAGRSAGDKGASPSRSH